MGQRWSKVVAVATLGVVLIGPGAAQAQVEPASAPGATTMAPPPRIAQEADLRGGGFVEFGARLNARAANGTATCRTATLPANTFRNCTWESLDLGTGESFTPPLGRGRITQVRIKAGNSTGAMRVVVLRAYRVASNNAYVCCTAVATSPTFTPARNRVTTVRMNLPVFQSRRPNGQGLYIDDHLALSMLSGNTVIPANIDGNGTSMGGWYPRWQVGQERTGPYGTSGAMILMRARWRPT